MGTTMRHNKSMSVARRLGLGFTFVGTLAVATALAGAWGLLRSEAYTKTIYEDRTVALDQLGAVNYLSTRSRVLLMDAVLAQQPDKALARVKQYETAREKADTLWKAYTATQMTPEETALVATVGPARDALFKQGFDAMAKALSAGKFDEARMALDKQVSPLNPAFAASMEKLMQLQVSVAAQEFQASRAAAVRAQWLMAALVLLVVGGSVVIGVVITRQLVRSLGAEPDELATLAERVAAGDLAADGRPPAGAGSVMASMQTMREGLVRVVSTVRGGVDNVATASAQIAQGNADLSSRTEEQAASLQQTAASMEQLTSTVRNGADNARQANQLAQGASAAAVRGGEVVSQVVQTMTDIQSASGKIAEITGVIDGIAFQTNILALNAAVEAARAGEQGRGFAVVASEVRTLAQRSADAARQIKALIGDSVTQVEAGSQLVQDAGRTMGDVVAQVRRVSDLIGEISAAATEQTQGIDQVGQAVTQLDQTTQQNAALVEESAAAAESLKAQAQRLSESVAVFQLGAQRA